MGCASSSAMGGSDKRKFHESYKLGRKLGEGAFGQVRVAKARLTNEELAVKIVDVRCRDFNGEPTREADRERVVATRSEIKAWDAVGVSDYTVSLQAHFFEKNLFYMVMEKCDCSLMDKLSKASTMLEQDLTRIFTEMLMGIKHVHEMQIVHRDIKPDNFLFGGPTGTIVKLCDFGLAAKLPKSKRLKGVYGTAPYMSPEMLQGNGYDELTDVWSFGATAFLMIHGDFPYSPNEATAPAMKKVILLGKPEIRFIRPSGEEQFFSKEFVDRATPFLQALLQRAPSTRKSAAQVLQTPFLQKTEAEAKNVVITLSDGEEAPLAPAFRKARKATKDVKALLQSPVKQRNLDEVLIKLQEKLGSEAELTSDTMYFSEEEGVKSPVKSEKSDDRIRRRSDARHSTHSGVLSAMMLKQGSAGSGPGTPSSMAGDLDLPIRGRTSSTDSDRKVHFSPPASPAASQGVEASGSFKNMPSRFDGGLGTVAEAP
mmetsp:Transcript_108298/g.303342  ORF Transcript_108298/g.303342 Transcript_108298/m.303342 type:complete len:484 (+) Transcript_108298:88-1539(+)